VSSDRAVLALDVGGTGMKGAVVDGDGGVRRELERPTPAAEGPDAVVAAVRAAARELAGPDVAGVGAVVPGSVDVTAGIARYSANLGWRDVPLRDLLIADLGLPVTLEHDVRAAGVAESTLGRARGLADCLIMIIGTGIAGVVRSNSTMIRGAADLAGEIGHIPVYPDGEMCACGQQGCLETYASAAAVSRRYLARSGRSADARAVLAARDTDPDAAQVWDDATRALGIALATYTFVLDPTSVILGGGLAEAGAPLLDPVRAELRRRIVWRPVPDVQLSTLGTRAGQLGAAVLAWRSLGRTAFDSWLHEA
jgi:glucokinase